MGDLVCDRGAGWSSTAVAVTIAAVLLALGVSLGCSTSSNFDGTRYLCPAPEMSCPPTFQCVSGVCLENGVPVDGGQPDAGTDGGPQATSLCGLPSDLNASFDVEPFHLDFYGEGTFEYLGGELALAMPPSPGDYREGQIYSEVGANLSGGRIVLEQTNVAVDDPSTRVAFRIWNGSNQEEFAIYVEGTSLRTALWVGGTEVSVSTTTFDPLAHRYWALGESDGLVSFEVSADKASWTLLNQMAAPNWLESSRVRIGLSASDPESGVSATFGELFGEVVEAGDATGCTTADFVEGFDDSMLTPLLELFSENCGVAIADGEALFTFPDDTAEGYCSFRGRATLDLNERPASVEHVGPLAASASAIYFDLIGQGAWASFEIYDAGIPGNVEPRIKYLICPNDICTEAADEALNPLERFWRFRADGPTLYWEVSTDSSTWRIAATSTGVLELSRVTLNFGTYNLSRSSQPIAIEGLFELN